MAAQHMPIDFDVDDVIAWPNAGSWLVERLEHDNSRTIYSRNFKFGIQVHPTHLWKPIDFKENR